MEKGPEGCRSSSPVAMAGDRVGYVSPSRNLMTPGLEYGDDDEVLPLQGDGDQVLPRQHTAPRYNSSSLICYTEAVRQHCLSVSR